jgi:hypothetical protein
MRAEKMEMQRLGDGGEPLSSLEARAGGFLREARAMGGLREADVEAIAMRLAPRERGRRGLRLLPVLAALAVLCAAGSVMAVVGGWRPRIPFLGSVAGTTNPPPAPAKAHAKSSGASAPVLVEPFLSKGAQAAPAPSPEPRSQPAPRRLARAESSGFPASAASETALAEGALSVEARSLAAALARWRHDGKAEAALALLTAHQRRYPHGALSVEARVARAEILLALSRKEQALAVLDSLTLANLPRARELATLRGELRARAGRCQDARADLARVLSSTANDGLGKRASRALAACP